MPIYDKEWIIRYVDGELSPEELGPFEKAIQTDPELAADIELYRQVKAVLAERLSGETEREALLKTTSRLRNQYFGQERPNLPVIPPARGSSVRPGRLSDGSDTKQAGSKIRKMKVIRRLVTIAAAACIFLATVLLWPGDTARKLDRIGETEMIGMTERGDQTDTLLQQAATFFNQQQFEKALPLLNRAVVADSTSQLALFYRGIAAWHTGDLPLARSSLQQVYDNASVLTDQAAFYIALTYAGENNKAMAMVWLRKIPATSHEQLKVNELQKLIE